MKKTNIMGVILMLAMSMAIICGFYEWEAYTDYKELMAEYGEDTALCDWVFDTLELCKVDNRVRSDYVDLNGDRWECRWDGVHSFEDFEGLMTGKIASVYYRYCF